MAKLIRLFGRYPRHPIKRPFDIVRIRKPKFNEAINFMYKNYLDDPFIRSMGIEKKDDETRQLLTTLWEELLNSELSLAAVKNDKICGVCINSPQSNQDEPSLVSLDKLADIANHAQTKSLLRAYNKIDREIRFPVPSNTAKTLELTFCAIGRYDHGLGIEKKIISSSADLAMLMGYEYARLDATNSELASTCNKLGWNKIWEMPFDRFEGIKKETIKDNNSIVSVYVKPLQPEKK